MVYINEKDFNVANFLANLKRVKWLKKKEYVVELFETNLNNWIVNLDGNNVIDLTRVFDFINELKKEKIWIK